MQSEKSGKEAPPEFEHLIQKLEEEVRMHISVFSACAIFILD
jgi:hypothetical protein